MIACGPTSHPTPWVKGPYADRRHPRAENGPVCCQTNSQKFWVYAVNGVNAVNAWVNGVFEVDGVDDRVDGVDEVDAEGTSA